MHEWFMNSQSTMEKQQHTKIFACSHTQILELDNIKTHHWSVVGVSAVTGDKLLNSVDWLIGDIAKRIFTFD